MRASRSLQRTNLTYAAFVSDDAEFTQQLPQFIIGDFRSFPARRYQAMFDASPRNIVLVCAPTAWCTHKVLRMMLKVLGKVHRSHRPEHQMVLCMDTAGSHIHADVLRTMHEDKCLGH